MSQHQSNITRTLVWSNMHSDIRKLGVRLADKHYTGIIAVSRGGLIPATILSHQWGVPIVGVIDVKSYNDENMTPSEARVEFSSHIENSKDNNWVIVDDLYDTGQTSRFLERIFHHYEQVFICSKNINCPHQYQRLLPPFEWLIFPWEK